VRVTVWSDYLCPWCYLALDREALLDELGVAVVVRPYELHPEIPPAGTPLHDGGRTAAVFDRVGAECELVGLPFRRPARSPNTRDVLAAAEHVRLTAPDVFPTLHRALFAAHFAEGRDLGDPSVVDELVRAAGGDPGRDHAAVTASIAEARDAGVTGTPAFLFDSGLLVPGVQPRAQLERWVARMADRRAEPG
jgi:predicted DsbA family dithiol-disulfide isomerase